jgi:hypothetical protein
VKKDYPTCRTELPPGTDKLLEDAARLFIAIKRRVTKVESSWVALKTEEEKHLGQMQVLLTKASGQRHAKAQCLSFGNILSNKALALTKATSVR